MTIIVKFDSDPSSCWLPNNVFIFNSIPMSPTKLLPFPLLVPYYQQNDTTTESYKNSGGSERVVYFFCWNETNAMPLSSFTKLLSIKYMEDIYIITGSVFHGLVFPNISFSILEWANWIWMEQNLRYLSHLDKFGSQDLIPWPSHASPSAPLRGKDKI